MLGLEIIMAPLRCVQRVACFELGVRANAQVQLGKGIK